MNEKKGSSVPYGSGYEKMKKESTEKYKKSLEKIVRDKKLKMLSKKDKETLLKIAQLMKSAND